MIRLLWDTYATRRWLRKHMNHPYTNLAGDTWTCTCGAELVPWWQR